MGDGFEVLDVGTMPYREAWDFQLAVLNELLEGKRPRGALILLEHPPVITIGRHPGSERHLLASAELLRAQGVEVVETDRGGDITFHGPGQLVAYPILPLNFYKLNLHAYMRLLEEVVIETLAGWGVEGHREKGATGVWVGGRAEKQGARSKNQEEVEGGAKVCAMGVKLKRWITLHGLALNVSTDLNYFSLINPCGLSRPVTSLRELLGSKSPTMQEAKARLAAVFQETLSKNHSQALSKSNV